ncbi:carboxypeptidase-like regulatory domain-containing protein [Actinophytocola glycyrrhizae]|uniref:Carboxypeptidase-like regulatory domain-containing protein n=1 Tax=Actinophytocola glycyrrhizae TaxID=2044873 RepID=A0ABV9RYN4_9PSEU
MSTLGVVVAAAVLVMSPVAVADPTESTSPSAPPTTETTETTTAKTTETPAESSAPGPGAPGETPREDAAPASIDDFTVSATFDKTSYATGEDMRITVSIKNNGTTATTVSADAGWSPAPDHVRVRDSGDLRSDVPIAAGATVTMAFVGGIGNPDVTTGRLRLSVWDETGATEFFEFTIPVTPRFAHASGTAFDDRDGDNRLDAGEELGGVTLTWQNSLYDASRFTVTTGPDGTFSLPRLPTAPYFVSGTAPDGLLIGYRSVTVDESGLDDLLFRAVRQITDLAVDLEFTEDTYRRDDTPTVRVTLTNNGDLPLTGILAYCNRGGGSQGMQGAGPGWGALAEDGVDIAPHSTLELTVTEPMPEHAYLYGHVVVGCDFGYSGVDEGNPYDNDRAAVPGMRGDIVGFVGRDETGLAGVRVVLVSDGHCPIVAEATTGEDGRFALHQVPVGLYDLYLYPPAGWRIKNSNPSHTQLVGAGPADHYIQAEPGDTPTPELPEQPADCAPGGGQDTTTTSVPPAPQGSAPPGLASTGASIAAPAAVGVLALLTGLGALLVTRRRRTT